MFSAVWDHMYILTPYTYTFSFIFCCVVSHIYSTLLAGAPLQAPYDANIHRLSEGLMYSTA